MITFEKIMTKSEYIEEYNQSENFQMSCCFSCESNAEFFGLSNDTIYPMSRKIYEEYQEENNNG
jgi:hypothetical protein